MELNTSLNRRSSTVAAVLSAPERFLIITVKKERRR